MVERSQAAAAALSYDVEEASHANFSRARGRLVLTLQHLKRDPKWCVSATHIRREALEALAFISWRRQHSQPKMQQLMAAG